MKFKELGYRANHSFVIADRIEDMTKPDLIRKNEKCDRDLCFYGYVRGCAMKKSACIHIPGSGDYMIHDISFLSDPCPLPTSEKKRTLDDRDRLVYAPFSGVGGLTYDKDAVYIELGGSHSFNVDNNNKQDKQKWTPGKQYFENIIKSKKTIDSKLAESKMKIFSGGQSLESIQEDIVSEVNDPKAEKRERQRVGEKFFDSDAEEGDDDDDDDEDGDEDDEEEMEQNGSGDENDNFSEMEADDNGMILLFLYLIKEF